MKSISKIESSIIELLAKKDEKAIALLYANYAGSLYGIILRIVKETSIAEETLQDVFLKIWKHSDKYDASKARLFTWMSIMARRTAIDTIRTVQYRESNQSVELESYVYDSKSHSIPPASEESGIRDIINSMEEKHQEIMHLVFLEGYTHKELEKKLNLPLGTVKSRIRSAITALRSKADKETIKKYLFLTF